jgi:hypothetical protein
MEKKSGGDDGAAHRTDKTIRAARQNPPVDAD